MYLPPFSAKGLVAAGFLACWVEMAMGTRAGWWGGILRRREKKFTLIRCPAMFGSLSKFCARTDYGRGGRAWDGTALKDGRARPAGQDRLLRTLKV